MKCCSERACIATGSDMPWFYGIFRSLMTFDDFITTA
jgi:hypothetical protein